MDSSDGIKNTIAAMLRQEATAYKCDDYLYRGEGNGIWDETSVDEECRAKMTDWCIQVVDFCECDRESVCIAMSYLDRFLCTAVGKLMLKDRKQFQLASMCCLYTAIKLFETREMNLDILADLSRGCYTQTDIAGMEKTMLSALEWRMHPPTPMNFVNYFHQLLPPTEVKGSIVSAVEEISRIQCVLVIKEYDLVTCKSSVIAIASMLNALDMMGHLVPYLSAKSVYISNIIDVFFESSEVDFVRRLMYKCVDAAASPTKDSIQQVLKSVSSENTNSKMQRSASPVCVSRRSQ